MSSDLLAIYLNDHLAGSSFGLELARRARGANEGTDLGRFLAGLADEIEEDKRDLEQIMARLDVAPDRLKPVAAWLLEKAGRLKLNGRLIGYSPLSRVVELEGLQGGVHAKLSLWRALHELTTEDRRLDAERLGKLIERAEHQLDQLRERHLAAVEDALARS